MRRVGKTTLYRHIFEQIPSDNKVFLDIENPIDQKLFEETDYNNIIANLQQHHIDPQKKIYLFLDEIQSMPQIVHAIKYLYDHYQIKFFVTGSSSFYLKNVFPESLAGRKFIFTLYPLDFEEFLIFKNSNKTTNTTFHEKSQNKNIFAYEKLKKQYEEYARYGGFPEVVLENNNSQKELILSDIFKSYFEKEVKILADFGKLSIFRDCILLLMQRVGSKLEIAKLSSELGISRDTVYSYLAFLEGTYFIHLIRPFTKNRDREVSGTRKVYFCDSGILNLFAQISEGALFENTVFHDLMKYGNLSYYQKRSGAEIDFILNENTAIEVKSKGTTRDLDKLTKIACSLKLKQYVVVSGNFVNESGFIPMVEL
jgi:hypothetical protein